MAAPTQPLNPPGVHGKGGVLAVSTSKAGAVKAVALITEISVDRTSDYVETTALGDSNKTWCKGLQNAQGTFSGVWDSTDDTLFDAAESIDGCQLEYWPSTTSPAVFKGPVWLDVSIKQGVSAAVTIEGKFSANGPFTRVSWGVVATSAAPGTGNGTFTPAGASAPPNFAALTGVTASPATAWTVGQQITLGDGTKAHWSGTAWATGPA